MSYVGLMLHTSISSLPDWKMELVTRTSQCWDHIDAAPSGHCQTRPPEPRRISRTAGCQLFRQLSMTAPTVPRAPKHRKPQNMDVQYDDIYNLIMIIMHLEISGMCKDVQRCAKHSCNRSKSHPCSRSSTKPSSCVTWRRSEASHHSIFNFCGDVNRREILKSQG